MPDLLSLDVKLVFHVYQPVWINGVRFASPLWDFCLAFTPNFASGISLSCKENEWTASRVIGSSGCVPTLFKHFST
uniref:Uncharacterized protein n=1 Tax=Arundo donax TaxID=35708 RepID=A0A0A9CGL3_ARUDO